MLEIGKTYSPILKNKHKQGDFMARMHSGSKGQSGSTKPAKKVTPTWVRYKPQEVEILVSKLAKDGKTGSEIGVYLRDTYGIPDVKLITEKSISKILDEKKLSKTLPEDLLALIKRVVQLNKHMEKNRHDMSGKRGIQLAVSKINRLVKYYKDTGRVPAEWKFNQENAIMYLE
jgi:small subunit ribosomal protein S15